MPFPLEEQWIIEAERLLGKRLPDSYRTRMLRENGGDVEIHGDSWTLYPVFDQSDRKRLSRTCNHIIQETTNAHRWSGFPSDALAIASNGSGDLLVLLPDDEDRESFGSTVFFWDHETGKSSPVADTLQI